jgi:phytoene dehydrogenase-like protein
MGAIAQALADAGRAAGAEIRAHAPVERILLREEAADPHAEGVVLTGGEEVRAKLVISCADPKRTFLGLVGEQHLPPDFARAVRGIAMKGCSMKINLALDGLPDFKAQPGGSLQPHHKTTMHICPDLDYLERAWDDAKYGAPSAAPLLEMTIPTVYDDSIAPPGKHIMGIFLQYTPYDLRHFTGQRNAQQPNRQSAPTSASDWPSVKECYADRVMDLISQYAPGFKELVLARQVLSPWDLEEVYGLTGGNIFHGEMSPAQLFFMRPVPGWARYRTPVRGLWLCGSGTHPGGGVMGAPGYNAAREILKQSSDQR